MNKKADWYEEKKNTWNATPPIAQNKSMKYGRFWTGVHVCEQTLCAPRSPTEISFLAGRYRKLILR